jgi:hypothetical protein
MYAEKSREPGAVSTFAQEVVRQAMCSQREVCLFLKLARSTYGMEGDRQDGRGTTQEKARGVVAETSEVWLS